MTTLLIASRNAHKAAEIREVLGAGFCIRTLEDFPGAPAAVEDAETFAGNARKKTESLARWLPAGLFDGHFHVLADDSGLEVDALNGAPGVHSARFAADETGSRGNSPDAANNAKLLRLLESVPMEKRTGRFRCVLALATGAAEEAVLFEGACEGRIALAPSGSGGFGYDPLFVPEGCDRSFADLGAEIKNKISHRARALEKLREYAKGNVR